MGLINNIKEKHQTNRQNEIKQQAEGYITLKDFENKLYIAYAGTPLIEIDETWTSKEIIGQLSVLRSNFINARTKMHCSNIEIL